MIFYTNKNLKSFSIYERVDRGPYKRWSNYNQFSKTELVETGPIGLSVSEVECPINVKKMTEDKINNNYDADFGRGFFHSTRSTPSHHQPSIAIRKVAVPNNKPSVPSGAYAGHRNNIGTNTGRVS